MAQNQQAIPRYRVILKTLRSSGQHASQDIHQACVNSGIDAKYRTIQKDLQDLRDDPTIFGRELNIKDDPKTKKWYSDGLPKEIFTLLELEDEEVTALLFYAKTMNQYSDYPLFQEMSKAIRKVIDTANIPENLKQLFEAKTIIETEKHEPIKGVELIPDILHSIHQQKKIIIEYQKFDGDKVKKHEFRPVLLKEDKQMWYVIGKNIKYDDFMPLALDRIVSLTTTDYSFEPIEFDSEKHYKYSFGITVPQEEPLDVIIWFTPQQGNYLRTLPIHPTQEIIIDNDIEFKIKVKVIPSYEFYSKIKSYGEQAKVISPANIAENIQSSFTQALKRYLPNK
jgi:predicted DNA-binding transcriptional regulator YafY